MVFASRRNIDPIQPSVSKVLDFLTDLYDSVLGYSALNKARSAPSTIITLLDGNMTIGSHPSIQRFIKAVFQTRPALPRYQTTWDTSVVLQFSYEMASSQHFVSPAPHTQADYFTCTYNRSKMSVFSSYKFIYYAEIRDMILHVYTHVR